LNQNERSPVDELALIKAWTKWNRKSRSDYLDAIVRLSPEERAKDRGASWGSIERIFLHILEDYIWWFDIVFRGRKEEESDTLVGRKVTENDLRSLNSRIDTIVQSFMDPLKPEDLARPYTVHGTSGDGKPYTMTTCPADIAWHMVEEQLQHIGELNALFWQMDIDPPTHAWFSSELAWTR
jgi:uncharacterized damage-inducible protein DinB